MKAAARPVARAAAHPSLRAPMGTWIGHDGIKNWAPLDAPTEGTPSVGRDEKPFLGSNLAFQWMEGIKRYGLQRTFVQAYTMGIIKFGECVGEDVNGNRYYENLDYPHGQHRWVEYKDIHNPDASSVPPEWHGWFTHMQDAPGPSVQSFLDSRLSESKLVAGDKTDSSKVYTDHVGLNASGFEMDGLLNKTQMRARGYKIGGMYQQPGEADKFTVHAGHALNKKSKGRFEAQKGMHLWDPEDEEGKTIPQPHRPREVN
eukprot:CAMPEP_0172616880 /NCGR_PEP_ID=MMETSP1068-20121228/68525_1 /TAXON_ID=35684 /ORGANISM="Pseudopedinella elastica, Strain CCMP716" /LENGTH=257 /DNA_ID=CAMNT_0013422485 /DNA_START=34 /DNA_END=807 /DNA_ORIENTATION=+